MLEPDIFHECERFARRLIGVREGHPARDYSAGGVVTIMYIYCCTIRVVGPLSSAKCCPMQFTGCQQPVQRSYWPENAIDWPALW